MHFPNFSAYGEKIRMTKKYVCRTHAVGLLKNFFSL